MHFFSTCSLNFIASSLILNISRFIPPFCPLLWLFCWILLMNSSNAFLSKMFLFVDTSSYCECCYLSSSDFWGWDMWSLARSRDGTSFLVFDESHTTSSVFGGYYYSCSYY